MTKYVKDNNPKPTNVRPILGHNVKIVMDGKEYVVRPAIQSGIVNLKKGWVMTWSS